MKEFDKIIGYKDVKVELERIIDMMINKDNYTKLGVRTTSGLLLSGQPGVGKTLMAKCFLEASKRTTFTIRKDAPDGDFVKYIKKVFDEAKEKQPSIVYLDDLDKFANEDEYHQNTDEFITIQSCIDDCKDLDVFVIATANDLRALPKSLLRPGRFDKQVKVYNPNSDDAQEIVKFYLSNKKIAKDVDYKEVTRLLDGESCATLETVINEAGVYSAYEHKESIEMNDILRAFMRVVYKAPEVLDESESKYARNIAVHEAGHSVIAELLEPESVNLVTIKKHDGPVGGFTSYKQDDNYFMDKKFMENRIMSLLAGKAATELVYGTSDVGASEDLERATRIASRFVDDYCGYGFAYYQGDSCLETSSLITDRKCQLIQGELERYYQKTKKLLVDNKEFLDKLTDELTNNISLVNSDIQRIKKSCGC